MQSSSSAGNGKSEPMTTNSNPGIEAAIRALMRERNIDRTTAIHIYLKERLEGLNS